MTVSPSPSMIISELGYQALPSDSAKGSDS
jgi:hypothetical protein